MPLTNTENKPQDKYPEHVRKMLAGNYKVKHSFFGPFEQGRVLTFDDIQDFFGDAFTPKLMKHHVDNGALVRVDEPRTTTPVPEGVENPNPETPDDFSDPAGFAGGAIADEPATPIDAPAPGATTEVPGDVSSPGTKEVKEPQKKK